MNSYKAIICDLNGVLILDKPDYVSSPPEKIISKRLGLSLDDEKEKGEIKDEFNWTENKFSSFVNNSWPGAIPNLELIDIVKNLKRKGYKTAIVANTSGVVIRKVIQNYFGENIENLFDEIIMSSEVGIYKPDKKIFQLVLDKLAVKPSESIMIDDRDDYLVGARDLGMSAVLFINNEKLNKDLRRFGIF